MQNIVGEARRQACRVADHVLVVRNGLIGWRFVEQEQQEKQRVLYGKRVLELASKALTQECGRGFGLSSIRNMRQFYLIFKNLQIGQAMLGQFGITDKEKSQANLHLLGLKNTKMRHEVIF